MKILFIAYFHDPFPGVGAKRVSYWSQNIAKHGLESHVITATEQSSHSRSITFVKDSNQPGMLGKFIKDPGLSWKKDLIAYFESLEHFDSDIVLITGGPFMHFGVGKYLKRKFGVKLILDFRDPFAINPGFKKQSLKARIKRHFEKRFIKSADKVITVNEYCQQLLAARPNQIKIIENGFNELDLPHKLPTGSVDAKFHIAHAGTFISGNRNPEVFLDTLAENFSDSVMFHQFGKDSEYFESYRTKSFFNYEGMVSYPQLINSLRKMDACMLITEGKAFESTTKVFDYIGLNQKILLVTCGEIHSGNLEKITKNYPNVYWVKNNKNEISRAIEEMKKSDVKLFNPESFSRQNSLVNLVDLLKEIS